MKPFGRTFSHFPRYPVFFLAVLSIWLVGSTMFAGLPQEKQSLREREMNAGEQLRTYRHRIAVAASKNESNAPAGIQPHTGLSINKSFQTASTIFFYDNMESGVNGWTTAVLAGGTDNIWHQTTADASSPTHSWWAGIDGQGNYSTGRRIHAALISPLISLAGGTGPITLLFTESFVTEHGWDFCMVDVTTNGGTTWIPLRGAYGSSPNGDSNGWVIETLDLTPYAGLSINIRFHFDTGDEKFNDFPGWYVDDVVIFDQSGTITGKKFFDVNNNGVKDIGERGVKDWMITATGPITLTSPTNERGRYTFKLPLGTYTVSEQQQVNWTQKYPPAGNWTINLSTPDTLVDSIHFGNYIQSSFLNGRKYHDLNRNGTFDAGDTTLPEWRISLCDTNGTELDFDKTDSLGQYSLYIFHPGIYIVKESDRTGWTQTSPVTEKYVINVPNLTTVFNNLDFGNYYSDSLNSILGQKFEDLNHNGVKDPHEPGIPGFVIHLSGNGVGNRFRATDSLGYYKFLSLPKNKTYRVEEVNKNGWCRSLPESLYILPLTQGQYYDSVDFGNYQVPPGSISGVKFHDLNANGLRDTTDDGMAGFTIHLDGVANGASVSLNATTDNTGAYTFPGLWAGTYTLSEIPRQGWVQTYPANSGSHTIILGCQDDRTGVNFGNIDSLNGTAIFRTFLPESLALAVGPKNKHVPIKKVADKNEFRITFYNHEADSARQLLVRFTLPYIPGKLDCSVPGAITAVDAKFKKIQIDFTGFVHSGDSVVIHGYNKKLAPEGVVAYQWAMKDFSLSSKQTDVNAVNALRLPMPNAINVLQLSGNGLRVGLGGPHSIVSPSWKNVQQCLIERGDRMPIGPPRCLDRNTRNRLYAKERKYITPTEGQNVLIPKAIAFKVNIIMSQLGIAPPGFGGLVYDDGTGAANPFNDKSLYDIAGALDQYMTQEQCLTLALYPGIDGTKFAALLDSINGAFSGTLDTISWSGSLKLKGVRFLRDVPFLRFDTSGVQRPNQYIAVTPYAGPSQYMLSQNYPNPFNPTTRIEFTLPTESYVTLKVYNMLGQEVATLFDRQIMEDGTQQVEFNATDLPSGVYFYRMVAQEVVDQESGLVPQSFMRVYKMMLIK